MKERRKKKPVTVLSSRDLHDDDGQRNDSLVDDVNERYRKMNININLIRWVNKIW